MAAWLRPAAPSSKKSDAAPAEPLEFKVDTYVLETDFPTDLNLLWDAGRKCVDLIEKYRDQFGYALPGWRKAKDWRRRLKALERMSSQAVRGGGPDKEKRVRQAESMCAPATNSPPK